MFRPAAISQSKGNANPGKGDETGQFQQESRPWPWWFGKG
jgi:hypothetical protein